MKINHTCPKSEYSNTFIEGMLNRMEISYSKYGALKEAYPLKVSAIKSLELRLKKYKETGNLEHLIDAANYCLAPETRVLTRSLGWEQIGNLKIGDELIGFTEEPVIRKSQRKWCRSYVTGTEVLYLPRFKVTFESNGREIITSADHKWLACMCQSKEKGRGATSYKWLETGKDNRSGLRSDQNHFIPQLIPLSFQRKDWYSGWIAGILDGEGHINQKSKLGTLKIVWGQNLGLVNDNIKNILSRWGYDIYEYQRINKSGTITAVSSPRGGLKESLRLLMETRPCRLIKNLDPDKMGSVRKIELDRVIYVEPLDIGEVVALQTTSKTYIAEGYGHHNCMIEFMHPEKTDAYFEATDSNGSPGRVWHHGPANRKTNDK